MDKNEIFSKIVNYLSKNDALYIAVFGSYAKGLEKPGSDIDILVDFRIKKSLFEIVKIERELSELINIKVDLVTKNSLSPYISESVNKDLKVLS